MIALSCFEIKASIWATQALIIAIVSADTFMVPAITCSTNSPMRSRAKARCSASRASRPSEMILSSRPPSFVSVVAALAWPCSGAVLMLCLLRLRGGATGFAAKLLQRIGVLDHVLQEAFELVVAVH